MGELDAKIWFTFAQTVSELSCMKPGEVMRRLRAGEIPSEMRDYGDGYRVRVVHRDAIMAVLEAQPLPEPAKRYRESHLDWDSWTRRSGNE